jgi:uncharacterized protein YkwD
MSPRHFAAIAACVLLLSLNPAEALSDRLSTLEQRVVARTNSERARRGLPSLRLDRFLQRAARIQSDEMATLGYFSHTSPVSGHRTVRDRVQAAGLREAVAVGENIAYYEGHSVNSAASQVVADWMQSPGHRRNILSRGWARIGVAIAVRGRKTLATQVFAGR